LLHRGMVTANRIRLTGLLTRSPRVARASLLGAAVCIACSSVATATAAPSPSQPIPHAPPALARALVTTTADLSAAIGRWRPKSSAPPSDVVLLALYQQRIYRLLARETQHVADRTVRLLPSTLSRTATDFLTAHRELYRLTPPIGSSTIKVARARPAAALLGYYREAQRRFGVPWNVLASVNFVETKFGKLRSASAAGAQGPMQFMPATWQRYGLGGDIDDAHDAILGAANYLHASGAPGNLRLALHHYNPSRAYVDAVVRYARRIASDRTTFFALYSWQVFVKTPGGDRRVTGPGLP
jgi:membrane-bound lytic murein transglycosylase B